MTKFNDEVDSYINTYTSKLNDELSKDSNIRIGIEELINEFIELNQDNKEFRVCEFIYLIQSATQQIAKTLTEDECYDFGEQLDKIYRRD